MRTPGRLRLGVNVDHVATVRNARGGLLPTFALVAEDSGTAEHRVHPVRGVRQER